MPDNTDQTSQPQTPGAVLAGTPPATAPVPAQPPVQSAQPTPEQAADVARHHAIGRAAAFLFGQQRDPNTGEPVKQAPGAVFRSLLAGALLGGAIGSEGHAGGGSVGGFLSGFARGGNAVAQRQYERQRQGEQDAQQRQRMTLEEQRAADEHMLHQANAAKIVAETASFHHQQELHDQDTIDQKNRASSLYVQTLIDAGGTPAPIPINGRVSTNGVYNATELAKAFTEDQSILMGPPGTVRHFVDTHNASDLQYVEGKGWLNAAGDPVDLSKSTTVRAIDVPESLYRKRITHTGKEINAIAGYQLIPADQENKDFTAPLDAFSQLYAANLRNANQAAQAKERNAQANKANAQANKTNTVKRGTPAQFKDVEAKKAAALAKAEAAYEKDGDEAALARAKAAAQKAYEDEIRALGGSVTPAGGSTTSKPITPPAGKSVVYDPQNTPHFVDSDKLKSFLADPQYRGWHQ